MKKKNLNLLFVIIIFALSVCSASTIKEPEQIGKQAFEILKNINSEKGKEIFSNSFLSFEDIQEFINNEKVDKRKRIKLSLFTKDECDKIIEEYYSRIIEEGKKYGINWNGIKYLDFIYGMKKIKGSKSVSGQISFIFDDKSFIIDIKSVFNGKDYKLTEIRILSKEEREE